LFGHEKGAFTGADKRVKGKFELSHGGTLFLDEIADMTAAAQSKILRAVEYGEFERLGSENLECADVRLISATHLPIDRFVAVDHFRRDLFYRLSGITITLPPLRERPSDLRALVATEIRSAARTQGKAIDGLDEQALDRVLSHTWPGNLRELSRVMQAAVSLCAGDVIHADAIRLVTPDVVAPLDESDDADLPAGDLTLRTAELRHIRKVIAAVRGNKRKAARALGVARSTLDRKLRNAAPRRPR
jgi:transcriptional regulator with PAS, ATPase and Fis domain